MQQRGSIFSTLYIVFLGSIGFALIFPLLPNLLFNSTLGTLPKIDTENGRHVLLGLLLIAYPLAQIIGAPFFGHLADRFGRKKIIAWTLVGTGIGYALTALAITLNFYWLIFFGRLMTGFFSATVALCLATLYNLASDKRARAKKGGLGTAMIGIGWSLGILIGFQCRKTLPTTPLWGMVIANLTGLIILGLFYHEQSRTERKPMILKGIRNIIRLIELKQLRVLLFAFLFWIFGYYMTLQWIGPACSDHFSVPRESIMWLLVWVGIVWAVSSGLVLRWLVEHSSVWKIALWSLFFSALFLFFAAVSDFYFYFRALYLLAVLFSALCWSSLTTLISLAAPPEGQGKAFGLTFATLASAEVLTPICGGIIAGFSIDLVFFVCALSVLISFLILLVYVIRRKSRLFVD